MRRFPGPCAAFARLGRKRGAAIVGRCECCCRAGLPLLDGRCRGCRQEDDHQPQGDTRPLPPHRPAERFVMVLVCVHALSRTDIRRLLLKDLDLSRERLVYDATVSGTSSTWTNSPTAVLPHGSANATDAGQPRPTLTC